jgi:hypothetical protein
MVKNYDRTDLYWTRRGDYVIGPDGDILDTSDDPLRSLIQECRSRLQSDQGDWNLYPQLGANLSDLIGESNNKMTAESLKAKVIAALNQYGMVDTRNINISYLPLGPSTILLRLSIAVASTEENHLTKSLDIQILYNYTDNNIHIL